MRRKRGCGHLQLIGFRRFYQYYTQNKTSLILFFSYFAVTLSFLLIHNFDILIHPFYEGGDTATNSILISQAKHFSLLVGHYSRFGFQHPGPALLYLQAFSEILLYDWLGIVPTPFNAHLISILILNSLLLSVVMYIVYINFQSVWVTVPIFATIIGYLGLNSHLNSILTSDAIASTWIPHILFFLFFAFIVSAASVASNRPNHIYLMVFTGSMLVHGYVILPLFVITISFYSILSLLNKNNFNISLFVKTNITHIKISLGIILLFLAPILINTIINYPGEIGKYISYALNKESVVSTPSFKEVVSYYLQFWTNNALYSVLFILIVILLAYYLYKSETNEEKRQFILNICIVCTIATLLYIWYVFRVIDSLQFYFTGFFYAAVPFTCTILIGTVLFKLIKKVKIDKFALIISVIFIIFMGFSTDFTCKEQNNHDVPYIIEKLKEEKQFKEKTLVLDFPNEMWPKIAALTVALDRTNTKVLVAKPDLGSVSKML
jgi:hypothetical protein